MKLISSIVLLFIMLGCDSKTKLVEPQIAIPTQEVAMVTTASVQPEVEIVMEEQIDTQIYNTLPVIQAPSVIRTAPVIIDAPPPRIKEEITYNVKPSQEVRTVTHAPQLPAGYTEETKLVSIKGNIPQSCQMWTDGCNTCTRAKNRKAECTTYKCESNIKFSCLQWN